MHNEQGNLLKPLLDDLQHAGVYQDDAQIDTITITRSDCRPGGLVVVALHQLGR